MRQTQENRHNITCDGDGDGDGGGGGTADSPFDDAAAGALLRRVRRRLGMTQETLAATVGCSKSHLSQMESGQRRITLSWAQRLEAALRIEDGRLQRAAAWSRTPVPVREAFERSRARESALTDALRHAMRATDPIAQLRRLVDQRAANIESPLRVTQRVPIINKVAAGAPVEFTDLGYPVAVADDYVAGPDLDDPGAFAARVVGDSMAPVYREGEVVVFSPALPTPDGADCFVRLERDAETTFKRVYYEDGGRVLRLQPLNPAYEARRIDREDVAGLFAAAYVLRRVQPGAR